MQSTSFSKGFGYTASELGVSKRRRQNAMLIKKMQAAMNEQINK